MLRSGFWVLFVRRGGEPSRRDGAPRAVLLVASAAALFLGAVVSARLGYRQGIFTLLLIAAGASVLGRFGRGRRRPGARQPTWVVADVSGVRIGSRWIPWSEVRELTGHMGRNDFGDQPELELRTADEVWYLGVHTVEEIHQRCHELGSLRARGEGGVEDVPPALRTLREPE